MIRATFFFPAVSPHFDRCCCVDCVTALMKIEGIIYRLRRATLSSKSFLGKLLSSIYGIAKDIFYDNLPSDDIRDLPSFHAFTLGSFIYTISIAAFVTFIVVGYLQDRSSRFLALTSDSGECKPVPKTVSGQFLADVNGEWEGSDKFIYSKAIYRFTLPNYEGTNQEYAFMMEKALDQTEVMGQEGYQRNLGINILAWTVFSSTIRRGGSANQFSMSGSPRAVFDRRIFSAAFAGIGGQCPIRPSVSYNTDSAQLTLKFSYNEFISNPSCFNLIDPRHMGYMDFYSGPNFQIVYDARSALTALAINYGLLSIDELELIPGTTFTELVRGENLTVSQYYYPRYPGMRPLVCLNSPVICVLQIYESYLYPLFNHLGNDPTRPLYCDCTIPEMIRGGCHLFNFVSSFAFFDYNATAGEDPGTSIERLIAFSQSGSGAKINRDSFNATFYAVENSNTAPQNLQTYRRAMEFCRVGSSYCSVLSVVMIDGFEIIDGMVYNPGSEYTVSDNYYQVRYGACNDTFTISADARDKLTTHPPLPLEEPYYECRSSKISALVNAWGISSGNMATVVPLLVVLMLTVFFSFANLKLQEVPRTYASGERDSVLNYLAFNLLLVRDGRYRGMNWADRKDALLSSIERNGSAGDGSESSSGSILRSLYEELAREEQIPRFFYDKVGTARIPSLTSDIVLESTSGVMMTEIHSAEHRSVSDQRQQQGDGRYSVDAVVTESQYDHLPNPLFVPRPQPS
jgi:hypothetical protein